MAQSEFEEIGFVRYSGDGVGNGVIDAASAGSALLGLDEALRFFNSRQSPDLATLGYDIPVRTQAGSWEAIVLASLAAGAGALTLGYLKKAGEKLAENDFKDVGLKDVLKKSMRAVQTLIRIVKHTRRARGWEQARIVADVTQPQVAILNDQGDELLVPVEFLQWYEALPPQLLVKMTSVVRVDRVLFIGVYTTRAPEVVEVVESDKPLFDESAEEEIEDILFPELAHGATVRLEGRLIRGNQASNSIGLEYQGHVINCVPEQGGIRRFKPALFLRCLVEGQVTRHAKNRFVADRRPTIIVRSIKPLELDGQGELFAG